MYLLDGLALHRTFEIQGDGPELGLGILQAGQKLHRAYVKNATEQEKGLLWVGLGTESSVTSREIGQVDKVERHSRQKEMPVQPCRAETSTNQSGQPRRVGPPGAMKQETALSKAGKGGGGGRLGRLGSLSARERAVHFCLLESSLCRPFGKSTTEETWERLTYPKGAFSTNCDPLG